MFQKSLIPAPNPHINQFLSNVYGHSTASADQKGIIDKKLEKIDQTIKDKIAGTITISEYFDQLWTQSELKDADKDFVIAKLETIQQSKKLQIQRGEQSVAKQPSDVEIITAAFKMTPYEEFNFQEKIKEVKKKKIDLDSGLVLSYSQTDLDVLHALNRPYKSAKHASTPTGLHYTAGLYDSEDDEISKKRRATKFVKKIQDEKKAFQQKIKQIEQTYEDKNNQEMERFRTKEQKEEDQRQNDRKNKMELHIKELKARSEVRLKDQLKWEEDYKQHQGKKPLFKEIQANYKKTHLLPELEERKRKLQEIRDFHKPIGREDIAEHERKVLQALEEKARKKEAETSKWVYKKPEFESKHHKIFADEVSKIKRRKEEDHMEKLKRKERVMELVQEVKQNYLPKIDPQKELELMTLIDKLKGHSKKKNNRSRTADEDDEEYEERHNPRKLGDEYLKSVKELVKRRQETSKTHKDGDGSKKDDDLASGRLGKQNTTKSDGAVLRKYNYLVDLRKENKIHSNQNQVDMIIKNKNLESEEKKELLQSEVEKLEEKAKRMEQIRKFKKTAVQDDDEVDKIYINAIKAKLEMLGS